jgi:hypothetical protein
MVPAPKPKGAVSFSSDELLMPPYSGSKGKTNDVRLFSIKTDAKRPVRLYVILQRCAHHGTASTPNCYPRLTQVVLLDRDCSCELLRFKYP